MYDCSQVEEEEASLDRLCRGFNGQSDGTILERKRKNAKLHQIGTPKRRRNLIRNTRLTGRKPLKKPLLAAGSSDSSDKIDK